MAVIEKKFNFKEFNKDDINIYYDGEYISIYAEKREGIFKHISKCHLVKVGKININETKITFDGDYVRVVTPAVESKEEKKEKTNTNFIEQLASKLKGFINMYASLNSIETIQYLFTSYLNLPIEQRKKHLLDEELHKYDIKPEFLRLILRLHYSNELLKRGDYDRSRDLMDSDNLNKVVKLFVTESVLDEVILGLKSRGISNKNITIIISNYLSNNGKLSNKVKAYISNTEALPLIQKLNDKEILEVIRLYGYSKVSTYVANVLSKDYNKPKKIYAK